MGLLEQNAKLVDKPGSLDQFQNVGEDREIAMDSNATTDTPDESRTADSPKPKVLAVDDVEQNLRLLDAMLAQLPCEVIRAQSGRQALALVLEHEFAVMLLDVNMPDMDGYTVAQQARTLPLGRELPIVFITASDKSDHGILRGYDSGAVDYLFKPVQREVLRSKVRIFTDLYVRRQQIAQTRDELRRSNVELRELAQAKIVLAEEARRANADLARSYQHLRSTQAQLVQTAKMAALGELVAGLAHEVNNPLAFSLGHLDTTRRGLGVLKVEVGQPSDATQAIWDKVDNRLNQLHEGLLRIKDIVAKLQTFARFREGDFECVSVGACINAVVALVRHRFEGRIELELQLDAPDLLECFPTLLNEAVMGLIQNAIEAIEGTGSIMIRAGGDDEQYKIDVLDSGRGVPSEIRDRVFEPFFTTKGVGEGAGLGLPVAYSIARRHGGSLELTARSGGGTQACLRIPIKRLSSVRARALAQ
jgi:two-component system NtrC family sensor kinase